MPITDANQETLEFVEKKMCEVAKVLLRSWDLRMVKTKLQLATQEAFGLMYKEDTSSAIMLKLLGNVISALPVHQAELFDAQDCLPGFFEWNLFWCKSFNSDPIKIKLDLDSLTNVHIYYQKWVEKCESEECTEFQKLWELLMIRSTSEAICETFGSIMNQHTGKNRHLAPEYFSMEIFLRCNLGPMHLLEGLVTEVLAFDSSKSYLRKGDQESKFSSKNINKSSALDTFEQKNEEKSRFPLDFWNSNWSK